MLTPRPQAEPSAGWLLAEAVPICVPPKLVPQVWPHVWQMIQKAYDRTDYGNFNDAESAVFKGDALLWIVWREPEVVATLITRVRNTNKSKVCEVCAAGGKESRVWLHMMANIEQYARDMGCNRISVTGRKGWARLLPDFREKLVIIEKELT
jgi:hypothetical protein